MGFLVVDRVAIGVTVVVLGALFALAAMVVGMAVASPTAKRVSELAGTIHGAGRPPSPEQMAEMQKRMSDMMGMPK